MEKSWLQLELCSCIRSARVTLARTVQLAMTEALTNDTRQEANTALLEVDKGQSPADLSVRSGAAPQMQYM